MAPLPFSLSGYRFERGVQSLKETYYSALNGIHVKADSLRNELAAYRHSLAAGGEWIGERDDDGYVLWDREKLLDMDLEEAEIAFDEFRKSFALAIYHYWERCLRSYCGVPHGNHETIVKHAALNGIAIAPHLERLRHLANALKHNNRKWGDLLLVSWPELFLPTFQPSDRTDWYAVISLTDAHIEGALDAVLNSGPPNRRDA